MSNQDFQAEGSSPQRHGNGKSKTATETASDAFAQASDMAREAGAKAKQAASETAATMSEQFKEMLDRQIGHGANMAGQFAKSARLAADDLNQQSPVLAGFVHNFADKVEDYADEFQDQTVEHIARSASDFTRRQPALVFGMAALAGFFIFRTMKNVPETSSPSLQPDEKA